MGSKPIHMIPFHALAGGVETISDMHKAGWELRRFCLGCRLETTVSYAVLFRLYGPGARLWDRHPRCAKARRAGWKCGAKTVFIAQPPSDTRWHALTLAERNRTDGTSPLWLHGEETQDQTAFDR